MRARVCRKCCQHIYHLVGRAAGACRWFGFGKRGWSHPLYVARHGACWSALAVSTWHTGRCSSSSPKFSSEELSDRRDPASDDIIWGDFIYTLFLSVGGARFTTSLYISAVRSREKSTRIPVWGTTRFANFILDEDKGRVLEVCIGKQTSNGRWSSRDSKSDGNVRSRALDVWY